MKLQVRPNRTVGTKKYIRYYVDISKKKVKLNHWHKGTNVRVLGPAKKR